MRPIILTLLITMLWVAPLLAAPPTGTPLTGSKEPIEITSDRLDADDNARIMMFIGNAVAKQGDATIFADRLTVRYAEQGGDVDRVVAEGNVRIVQGERLATSQRADFFRDQERILLTGDPQVTEKGSTVKGHQITLFMKERRAVVQASQSGRVNAVFQPKKEGGR
jgi:lipopolysaccharide export system protein LptA